MREFDTDSDGKLSFTELQVTMVIRYQRWSLNLLKISAVVLTSFQDISGSAEASNIFKDISSVLICWFPEGGWEAKGERKPGRLRLCLIVLELKLLNAYDRYPTSLNYLSMVRNAVCILCVSYFGPFLHFFEFLSCAIFFSPPMEGAGWWALVAWWVFLVSWVRWFPGAGFYGRCGSGDCLECL